MWAKGQLNEEEGDKINQTEGSEEEEEVNKESLEDKEKTTAMGEKNKMETKGRSRGRRGYRPWKTARVT